MQKLYEINVYNNNNNNLPGKNFIKWLFTKKNDELSLYTSKQLHRRQISREITLKFNTILLFQDLWSIFSYFWLYPLFVHVLSRGFTKFGIKGL